MSIFNTSMADAYLFSDAINAYCDYCESEGERYITPKQEYSYQSDEGYVLADESGIIWIY